MVRAMCGVQLKAGKRAIDLMLVLALDRTIDEYMAMANSVCWYGHVLRREDGNVLKKAIEFEVEG